MYPYHNQIKRRIRAGELAGYAFVSDYPRIGEALVLYLRRLRRCVPFVRTAMRNTLRFWQPGKTALSRFFERVRPKNFVSFSPPLI